MPSPSALSFSTPSARFHLHTGVLLEANDSFFELADLQKDVLRNEQKPPTWLGTFGGALCVFLRSDTRAMVLRSMLLISAALSRLSRLRDIAMMEVDVLLVTRIGRLHSRHITLHRDAMEAVTWRLTAPLPHIFDTPWPRLRIEGDQSDSEDEEDEDELEDWTLPIAPFKKQTPWCQSVHRFEWRSPQLKKRKLKEAES